MIRAAHFLVKTWHCCAFNGPTVSEQSIKNMHLWQLRQCLILCFYIVIFCRHEQAASNAKAFQNKRPCVFWKYVYCGKKFTLNTIQQRLLQAKNPLQASPNPLLMIIKAKDKNSHLLTSLTILTQHWILNQPPTFT